MKQNKTMLEPWNGQWLVGVKGTPLQVCSTVQVELRLGEEIFQPRVVVVDGLTVDVIPGLDSVLEAHSYTVDIGKKTLHFTNCGISVIYGSQGTTAAIRVIMQPP